MGLLLVFFVLSLSFSSSPVPAKDCRGYGVLDPLHHPFFDFSPTPNLVRDEYLLRPPKTSGDGPLTRGPPLATPLFLFLWWGPGPQ